MNEILNLFFQIFGGLGIFIFGIRYMGDGLKNYAGNSLRKILSKLTSNRFMGLGIGAGITSIIQSSSATTVMVVGFVNAGLMTITQSVGVILGANIGTTITGQLIAFKVTKYALPIVGIGSSVMLFGKTKKTKHLGESIFGFGVLFLGLNLITSAVKPFGSSEIVKNAFLSLSHHPLLGILIGIIITVMVQSSSITIGLTIALSSAGLMDIYSAIPIILGDNIGTCVTALLASIGTKLSAKRAAFIHITVNVLGSAIILTILGWFTKLVLLTSVDISRQVANAHTIFNVFIALAFIPFVKYIVMFVEKIIPGKEKNIERGQIHLAKNLIITPALALEATQKELIRMARLAKEMLKDAKEAINKYDIKKIKEIVEQENVMDELQKEITDYVVDVSKNELNEYESELIPLYIHSVNDLERVGDLIENIGNAIERTFENKQKFVPNAQTEINQIIVIINEMLNSVIHVLDKNDVLSIKRVRKLESKINEMTHVYKTNSTLRMKDKVCLPLSGMAFVDLINYFEKIGDHLENVAKAMKKKIKLDE